MTSEPLLHDGQVAELLGVKRQTLATWRSTKRYADLRYLQIGRTIRYRRADVDAFLEKHLVGAVAAVE
jgi:excisionase family DNA binding protein